MKNIRTTLLLTLLILCITAGIATYLSLPVLLQKTSTYLLRNKPNTQLSFTSNLRGIQQLGIESFTFEQKSPQYVFRAQSPLITLRIDWSALLNGQLFSLRSKSLHIKVLKQPDATQSESKPNTRTDLDFLSTQLPSIHSLLRGVLQIDSLHVELPSEMHISPLQFSATRLERSKAHIEVTTHLDEITHTTSSASIDSFPPAKIRAKIVNTGAFTAKVHSVSKANTFAVALERNNTSDEEKFKFTADSSLRMASILLKRVGLYRTNAPSQINPSARIQGEILFSLKDSTLHIAEKSSLQLLHFSLKDAHAKQVELTVKENLSLSSSLQIQGSAILDISNLHITESLIVRPTSLEFSLRPSSKDKPTDSQIIAVTIPQLRIIHQEVEFLPLSINGELLLENSVLRGVFEVAQKGSDEIIKLTGEHDFLKQSGTLNLTSQNISLAPTLRQFSHLIPSALGQQKVEAGSADMHYRRNWGALASQLLTLQLRGLDMRGPGYQLSDAALSLALTNFAPLRLAEPIKLTADKLNFGVPLTNLAARITLVHDNSTTPQAIEVAHAQGTLLDGTLRLRKGYYSLQNNSGRFPLTFASVSIAEILALYPDSGISGQGRLHGELPLEIRAGKVAMQSGTIYSKAPGKLEAQLDTSALRQRYENTLGTLIHALENYYFSSLQAQGSLAPSGDLDLSLAIEGSNPEFQNGRQVNLNLSIHENLPKLLRSLQLSSELVGIGNNPKNLERWSTPKD